jgi:hypothetical protein
VCTVTKYLEDIDRFEITWPSGKSKNVSRLNLRFQEEDNKSFELRIEEAKVNEIKLNRLTLCLSDRAYELPNALAQCGLHQWHYVFP